MRTAPDPPDGAKSNRTCPRCGEKKDITEGFGWRRMRQAGGVIVRPQPWCRECRRASAVRSAEGRRPRPGPVTRAAPAPAPAAAPVREAPAPAGGRRRPGSEVGLPVPEVAHAAGTDAGNRSMRAAGRTVWAQEDLDAAFQEHGRVTGRPDRGAARQGALPGALDAKACRGCGAMLPVAAFKSDARASDGRAARCKDCVNAGRRAARRAGAGGAP